jgi:hypothetical protein
MTVGARGTQDTNQTNAAAAHRCGRATTEGDDDMDDETFFDELRRRAVDAAERQAERTLKMGELCSRAINDLEVALEPFRKHLFGMREAFRDKETQELAPLARAWAYENPERASAIVTAAVGFVATHQRLERLVRDASTLNDLLPDDDKKKPDGRGGKA